MPQYRRAYQPGGTFFLTLVTHRRRPMFADERALRVLRASLRAVRAERSFEVVAGVVLPDHLHVIWTLPDGDADFSSRVGRWKVLFTRGWRTVEGGGRCPPHGRSASREKSGVGWAPPTIPPSREKHRESDVWQRRFWEHLIRDQDDLNQHLDYIHYNPVKHGLASCPQEYAPSSFMKWVRRDAYPADWLCTCDGQTAKPPMFPLVSAEPFE